MRQEDDIAVVLLDVVMETEDAGLRLVRFLRDELGNRATRIILRTGQPGYAPEIETIRLYDINDYKTKSELTRVRLYTSITVAIRSYWQIHQLEANRRGLEMIVNATMELSRPRGLRRFAEGVVTQLCALLGIGEEGLVCAAASVAGVSPYVLAAAGAGQRRAASCAGSLTASGIGKACRHAASSASASSSAPCSDGVRKRRLAAALRLRLR